MWYDGTIYGVDDPGPGEEGLVEKGLQKPMPKPKVLWHRDTSLSLATECRGLWTKKNKFISYLFIYLFIMYSFFTFSIYAFLCYYYENLIYPDPTMNGAYFRAANFRSIFLP